MSVFHDAVNLAIHDYLYGGETGLSRACGFYTVESVYRRTIETPCELDSTPMPLPHPPQDNQGLRQLWAHNELAFTTGDIGITPKLGKYANLVSLDFDAESIAESFCQVPVLKINTTPRRITKVFGELPSGNGSSRSMVVPLEHQQLINRQFVTDGGESRRVLLSARKVAIGVDDTHVFPRECFVIEAEGITWPHQLHARQRFY